MFSVGTDGWWGAAIYSGCAERKHAQYERKDARREYLSIANTLMQRAGDNYTVGTIY